MCKEEFVKKDIEDTENKNKKAVELTRKQKEKVVYKKLMLFVIASFFVILLTSTVTINIVPTASMYPTIKNPCLTIAKKCGIEKVERFDIINVQEEYSQYLQTKVNPYNGLCKRIIAFGGEKVEIKDGLLYINDKYVEENFLLDENKVGNYGPFYVPEGKVFIMGDNRTHSLDSRLLKDPYIPEDNVNAVVYYGITKESSKINVSKYKEKR